MSTRDADSGVRLAEVVAAFSLATDLGLGQPMEHVLRSWMIATRLGDRMGIDSGRGRGAVLRRHVGMGGMRGRHPEVATWFGDDIAFRRDSYEVDFAGLADAAVRATSRRVWGARR